jgi:hypothetical protein
MLSAVINVVGALDFLVSWGIGWRYILSPRFRANVHAKWRTGPRKALAANIAFCIVAFVVLNGAALLFLVYTAIWLYDGIVVPRLSSSPGSASALVLAVAQKMAGPGCPEAAIDHWPLRITSGRPSRNATPTFGTSVQCL